MKQEHDYDLLEMRMQLLEAKVKLQEIALEESSKTCSILLDLSEFFMSKIEELNTQYEQNLQWDDWSD